MAYDPEAIQEDVVQWLNRVHPERTKAAIWGKLEEELNEASEKPDDITEWADIMIVLFDLAMMHGHYFDDILMEARKKLEINKNRTWKINSDGIMSHVKS